MKKPKSETCLVRAFQQQQNQPLFRRNLADATLQQISESLGALTSLQSLCLEIEW